MCGKQNKLGGVICTGQTRSGLVGLEVVVEDVLLVRPQWLVVDEGLCVCVCGVC